MILPNSSISRIDFVPFLCPLLPSDAEIISDLWPPTNLPTVLTDREAVLCSHSRNCFQ